MRGDASCEPRLDLGRSAQFGGRMHRHEARDGGDSVAMMVALEQAGLGEGPARSGPVENEAAPFGRGADEFQHPLANEDEAEGGVAGVEQRLAKGEAAVLAGRQRLQEISVYMTAIIVGAPGSALPASVMTSPAARLIAALALGLVLPAPAQHAGPHRGHHHHGAGQGGAVTQPYAGLEGRQTKAMSEDSTTALLGG